MTIRMAEAEDIPDALELCASLYHEEGVLFEIDPDKARAAIKSFVSNGVVVLAFSNDGEMVGCAAAVVDTMWWSKTPFLRCVFCYVLPEFRRSTFARDMLRSIKRAGEALGVKTVSDVLSERRTEGKCRLYQREFRELGKVFIYP